MHNLLMVVRREYLARVRTKGFWLGTLLFPLLMVGFAFVPIFLSDWMGETQRKIAFVDATRRLLETVRDGLSEERLKDGTPAYLLEPVPLQGGLEETRRSLEPRVHAGELYGIVTVGTELEREGNFRLYARSVGNEALLRAVQRALRNAVVGARLEKSHLSLDRQELKRLLSPIELQSFQLVAAGKAKQKGFGEAYLGTFAFVMVLYMSLLLYGIAVMRGILEEKSSRIVEVLLGSLSPAELMTGKILGIGLAGLTQISIYAVTGGLLRLYVVATQLQGGWTGFVDALSPEKMAYFVIYFVLGYFLFTALFATVGAMCNSEQEAQSLQTPLVMCLAIPMMATFFFVNDPDSKVAVIVSLIPIFTPMVMFMRISVLTPPFWQIALSILITLGSILLIFRGAGRIFRVGVLMYGKRPTLPEVLRWARS